MLFDTHLHLIYLDKLSYPWLENVPLLNKPSVYSDYAKVAHRLGITGCFHMEVDVAEHQIKEETRLISELMLQPNSLLQGVISSCRPENQNFPMMLDWVLENSNVKGLRRVLHVVPDDISQTEIFKNNVNRLSGTGISFDLCVSAQQISLLNGLVDYCPDVTFILDHCGVPDIRSGEFVHWSDKVSELSKRPNVFCKISGIIAYGNPETWTLNELRRYFDHVVSVFGPNRLVWGSDSPVCNLGANLETWVAVTRALCNDWTLDEKDGLFYKNVQKIWNIK
ncbi:MAG: amidohydrolase family protein [Paracoccaceae bacterium]|nr:amidohydrolase family protein [Paracoccaceae bacterium]